MRGEVQQDEEMKVVCDKHLNKFEKNSMLTGGVFLVTFSIDCNTLHPLRCPSVSV